MEAGPTQVVGDLSRAQLAGLFPQQWSKMLAYILVGKCAHGWSTDRGMLIAGSGRPRVLGPIELRTLITRAGPCRLDRSPLTPPAPADTPRRSEAEPR